MEERFFIRCEELEFRHVGHLGQGPNAGKLSWNRGKSAVYIPLISLIELIN